MECLFQFKLLQLLLLMVPQDCVDEIVSKYEKRRDVMLQAFAEAGWVMDKPNASMFIWAKIPEKAQHLGSLEFSKQLLREAQVAVSPGIGLVIMVINM